MGWFGKIIGGFLLLILVAVIADIISWVYEYAWVVPIVLVIIIGTVSWWTSLARKKRKLKLLIRAAYVDGTITERERQAILNRAMKMKIDSGEAEIYLEECLYKLNERRSNVKKK